jgi:uncharacterized protein
VTTVEPTPAPEPVDLRPRPVPDDDNRFYWDAAAQHRLVLQRCDRCGLFQYPPDVVCVHCPSRSMPPTELSGRATLYSYANVERTFHPGWTSPPGYLVGLVELHERPGLRMLSNLLEVDAGELEVGMALEVVFEDRPRPDGPGITMPQFRPARARTSGPAGAA